MDISIVVPVYNERHRLPDTLTAIIHYLKFGFSRSEILVVEDGSQYDVRDFVFSLSRDDRVDIRYLSHHPNRGKGFSVRRGMLEATGDLVGYVDADGAAPISEMNRLVAEIRDGADIAIGSRAIPSSDVRVEKTAHRFVMGRTFSFLVNALTGLNFMDTQCGFKLFRHQPAKDIFSEMDTDGFAFDVEALVLAAKKGYSVKEVPVNWADVAGSKVRLFRDSLKMLLDVVRIAKLGRG